MISLKKSLLLKSLPLLMQNAQAHRKPRWVPVAKSKMFRIPKRPVVSEEERLELLRINNNYKTQMRAIRRFYFEEMIKEKSSRESTSSEENLRREAEDWEQCIILNEKWNSEVAAMRNQRLAKGSEEMERYTLARKELIDNKQRDNINRASEEIRKQKELSASFITPETLDAAIEQALSNVTDYNYAIDMHGNKYIGRETPAVRSTTTNSSNTVS